MESEQLQACLTSVFEIFFINLRCEELRTALYLGHVTTFLRLSRFSAQPFEFSASARFATLGLLDGVPETYWCR